MTPTYEDIRQRIIETLANRPNGHEITPEEHQAFALDLLEYIKDVELITASTLVGYADANTVPVASDRANATYVNTIPNSTTIVFNNFRDKDGQSLSVTTPNDYAAVNILLWNKRFWEVHTTQIHISAIADLSLVLNKLKILPGEEFTTNVTCGGIPSGTEIPVDKELKEIIKDMLFMYIAPSVTIGGGGNYEIGTTQAPSITYKGVSSSSANLTKLVLKKEVEGVTTELEERDPATSGTEYSYNDSDVNKETKYTVEAYDNVKGETVAKTAVANIKFYSRYFYGYAAQNSLPTSSQTVRALAHKGFITADQMTLISTTTQAEAYYLVLAVPSGYHMYVENEFGAVINPILNGTVDVYIGEGLSTDTLTYKVFHIEGTPRFKNLKLIKD